MEDQLLLNITIDPNVMTGKLVIRDTRIPVELIIKMLSQGISESVLLSEYPRLTEDDIRAALVYTSQVSAGEDVFPLKWIRIRSIRKPS
jgi:uncharacterized protein (DUF433 family)